MRACPAMRTVSSAKHNYITYIHPPRKLSTALMKIVCTFAKLLRQTRAVPQMHMVAVDNITTSSRTCLLHSTAQRALCASASEQPKRPGVRVSARVIAFFCCQVCFWAWKSPKYLGEQCTSCNFTAFGGASIAVFLSLMSSCRLVCCCAGAREAVYRGCAKRASGTGSFC
jgi:hypothetical protein